MLGLTSPVVHFLSFCGHENNVALQVLEKGNGLLAIARNNFHMCELTIHRIYAENKEEEIITIKDVKIYLGLCSY